LKAVEAKFTPSCVLALRSTLAKRTLSRICGSTGGTSTRNRLMAFPSVPTMAKIRSAAVMSLTVPRTKAVSLSKVTLTSASG
jgi:hypothetical protein